MIKVTITFPIFNGLQFTKKCLESLERNTRKADIERVKYEIVIVDDNSIDGSAGWIKRNYPQVHLLEGSGDLWWSGGINVGIKYALNSLNTDYILWWNNDIIEDDDYFVNLPFVLTENNIKTLVGSKIYLDEKKAVIWSMGGIFNPRTGFKDMVGQHDPEGDEYKQAINCDWLTGMGSIIHRSVFEDIGYLDEVNFPQYHGDIDFTYRAKKNGFQIIADPRLKIYNDTTNSGLRHNNSFQNLRKSLVSIRSNYNINKDLIFYRKHTSGIGAYKPLFTKYYTYVGGFIKWKILGLFGMKNKETRF